MQSHRLFLTSSLGYDAQLDNQGKQQLISEPKKQAFVPPTQPRKEAEDNEVHHLN